MTTPRPPRKVPGISVRGGKYYLKWKDGFGVWRRLVSDATSMREAEAKLAELRASAFRQQKGLDPLPVSNGATQNVWGLCRWWLDSKCPEYSRSREEPRLTAHVLKTGLGALTLQHATTEVFDAYFDSLEAAEYQPGGINKLRSILRTVFSKAKKAKPVRLWAGENPLADTKVRTVSKKPLSTLRPEEVEKLLASVPTQWRSFFAAAIYLALRKGELCGLKKEHVNLKDKLVYIAVSYDHDTTKGGHADGLPIAEPLIPYLEEAMATNPGEYVFPSETEGFEGQMRGEGVDPQKILRSAMKRAGIVTGYVHSCRRCGHARRNWKTKVATPSTEPKYSATWPDNEPRECPQCKMKLWAEPIPRKMKFHDLRHSTATMLLRAGVSMHLVQKVLRHANIQMTVDTYGHLDVEDIRAAVNTIGKVPKGTPTPVPPAPSAPMSKDEMIAEAMRLLAEAQGMPAEAARVGPRVVQKLKVVK